MFGELVRFYSRARWWSYLCPCQCHGFTLFSFIFPKPFPDISQSDNFILIVVSVSGFK